MMMIKLYVYRGNVFDKLNCQFLKKPSALWNLYIYFFIYETTHYGHVVIFCIIEKKNKWYILRGKK
jgi:hypothetical protein